MVMNMFFETMLEGTDTEHHNSPDQLQPAASAARLIVGVMA